MLYGLEVGAVVRAPDNPEWGDGQIQSIVGSRITVNFEHEGKLVLVGDRVALELGSSDPL